MHRCPFHFDSHHAAVNASYNVWMLLRWTFHTQAAAVATLVPYHTHARRAASWSHQLHSAAPALVTTKPVREQQGPVHPAALCSTSPGHHHTTLVGYMEVTKGEAAGGSWGNGWLPPCTTQQTQPLLPPWSCREQHTCMTRSSTGQSPKPPFAAPLLVTTTPPIM
jgi:hypothetical protein